MNVVVVAGGEILEVSTLLEMFDLKEAFYVGVDAGAYYLLHKGLRLNLAVGDFDSLTPEQEFAVRKQADRILKVSSEKDDTDLQLALEEILKIYPDAHCFLLGVSGGRLDHFLTTLFLPLEKRFYKFASQIHLLDSRNWIDFYLPGKYEIQKIAGMKYFGLVTLTRVIDLKIKGMKYELSSTNTLGVTIYPSNEFIKKEAKLHFREGMVATIQSKD